MGLWDNEPDFDGDEPRAAGDAFSEAATGAAAIVAVAAVACIAASVAETVIDTLYFLAGEEREED